MFFEDLKAFVAVIDHNSLTRAADVLCLTQSAVSRRIQRLEEVLGANLFDRNSKPPKANALAQRIYQHAVPLLRGAAQLLDIPREGVMPSGTLRLGFTQIVADAVLFDCVMKMKAAFPALEIQLQTDWSTALQQRILDGGLDAATLMLRSPAVLPDGLSGHFVTALDVLAIQSRRKPLVKRHTTIKTLMAQDWILNPIGCGYRAALERAMDDAGKGLRLSVDTHDTETQLRMVAAGLGLGLVPRQVLEKSRVAHEIEAIEVSDFALNLEIWLVHAPQPGNLKQAIDLLADGVIDGLSKYGGARQDEPAGKMVRKRTRGAAR